ncbi:uncharacterized protein ACR2FA_002560 [Aphomia sociella]
MKLIIALAFLGVACALPEPVHLQPPAPAVLEGINFRPLIVPNEIIEKLSAIPAPEDSDVPAPVELPVVPSIDAEQIVDAVNPVDSYAVKFVDAPIEIPADAVRFVEKAENVYEKLRPSEMESIRVVDLPVEQELKNTVVVVEQPLPESPRYPGKQYADPTWR